MIWLLSGDLHLRLFEQTLDVSQSTDGSCNEPGKSKQRSDADKEDQDKQIQMVAMRFLKRQPSVIVLLRRSDRTFNLCSLLLTMTAVIC